MKISDTPRIGSAGAIRRTTRSRKAGGGAIVPVAGRRSVQEVATFLGIPPAELTPSVSEGIERLLDEIDRLRADAHNKDVRISHLERVADEDPLIPVLNRRAFMRELGRMLAFSERYGMTASVLYMDINGMKTVNDLYGHAAGDAALTHIAQLLLASVRSSDVVGRLGGDEFGLILAHADHDVATEKGRGLAAALEDRPFDWRGKTHPLSFAYGVRAFSTREDANVILADADNAMYAHKKTRRGA